MEVHLPLADHVHGFDSGDDDSCPPKRLESEYLSGDSFDGPVVLLDDVVQVLVLSHQDIDPGSADRRRTISSKSTSLAAGSGAVRELCEKRY